MPLKIEKYDADTSEFVFSEFVTQSDNPLRVPNTLDSGEQEMYLMDTDDMRKCSYIRRIQPLYKDFHPLIGLSYIAYNTNDVVEVAELKEGQEIELFLKLTNQTPLIHIRLSHV